MPTNLHFMRGKRVNMKPKLERVMQEPSNISCWYSIASETKSKTMTHREDLVPARAAIYWKSIYWSTLLSQWSPISVLSISISVVLRQRELPTILARLLVHVSMVENMFCDPHGTIFGANNVETYPPPTPPRPSPPTPPKKDACDVPNT